MQLRAFPMGTRVLLADLELQYERGQVDATAHAEQERQIIADARTTLGLDDTWRTDPTPPELHYPTGRTSVFWKP